MSAFPPADPQELQEFPTIRLVGTTFYRIHRADRDPAHFSTGPAYRFSSPTEPAEYGSCYLAHTPEGAFIETLGRVGLVPERELQSRVLSELIVPETAVRIADLTNQTALGQFVIDGDLAMGADYTLPQAWSFALHEAGFDGVYYLTRHDVSGTGRSLALFGPPGAAPGFFKSEREPVEISEELLLRIRSVFGVYVVPDIELP